MNVMVEIKKLRKDTIAHTLSSIEIKKVASASTCEE
jgi:hypothetical protein